MLMQYIVELKAVSEVLSGEIVQSDDWLNNNDLDLLNDGAQLGSTSEYTNGQHYHCESLKLKITDRGVFLLNNDGEIELFSGDKLTANNQTYHAVITSESVSAPVVEEKSLPQVSPQPAAHDIWGSDDVKPAHIHVPDPFANQYQGTSLPTIENTARHNSVAAPFQVTNVNSSDSLGFLYEQDGRNEQDPNALLPSAPISNASSSILESDRFNNTPNYFNGVPDTNQQNMQQPSSDANVLSDLGIDEAYANNMTERFANSSTPDVMNESPADRLDEFLSTDDERYYSSDQTNYPANPTATEKASWVSGVKNVFKR